jgi:hypothetical protein
MTSLKENNSTSAEVFKDPRILEGSRASKDSASQRLAFYKRMVSKKSTLATIATSDTFRYALFIWRGNWLDIESFGELSRYDLLLESNDLLDLHRAGLNWIEENTELEYRDVLVVSSDLDFFVRRLKLPPLKKSEITRVASWEVSKQIPISIKDSYLFIKGSKKRTGRSVVTVGAVPRTQIDRWQYIGEHLAGIIPMAVSLVPLGPGAVSTEAAYCYVCQTNSEINIGFYNSEGLQYSHTAQATSARYEPVLSQSRFGPAKVVEALTNSIEVLYSHFPGMKVEGIVLLVPPEEVPELSRAIAEQVEIKIISVDPYAGMSRDSRELWESAGQKYLPLLGAVLVGERDFKFLPRSIKDRIKKKKINKLIRYLLFFGIFVELVAASLWINDVSGTKSELARLRTLKEKTESSDAYLQSVEYQSRAQFLEALGDQFASRNNDYSMLLKVFSSITPNGIYLENVSAVRKEGRLQLNIGGYYDGDFSEADVAMMKFMEGLKSRGVEHLKLQRLGQKLSGERKTESFILEGRW